MLLLASADPLLPQIRLGKLGRIQARNAEAFLQQVVAQVPGVYLFPVLPGGHEVPFRTSYRPQAARAWNAREEPLKSNSDGVLPIPEGGPFRRTTHFYQKPGLPSDG